MKKCYCCGKAAVCMVRDVGLSHSMDIWVCSDHTRGGQVLEYVDPVRDVEWRIEKLTNQIADLQTQRARLIDKRIALESEPDYEV